MWCFRLSVVLVVLVLIFSHVLLDTFWGAALESSPIFTMLNLKLHGPSYRCGRQGRINHYIKTAFVNLLQSYLNHETDHTTQNGKQQTGIVQDLLQRDEKGCSNQTHEATFQER